MLLIRAVLIAGLGMVWAIGTTFAQMSNCDNERPALINGADDRFAKSWRGPVEAIVINEREFDDKGSGTDTTITLKIDRDGRLSEYFLQNARIPKFGRTVYSYDANGNIVKKTSYNPDGSAVLEYLYTYDQAGNLLSKFTQNAKSKVVIGPKSAFKYKSSSSYIEYSDGQFVRRISLKRDDRCRVVESMLLKENGALENKLTMKYDDQNDLIEQVVYSPSGKPAEKLKWEYEYDDRGNWITKRFHEWHYWDRGDQYTLSSEEKRTIKYSGAK